MNTNKTTASEQLLSIQSMLVSGHQSINIERHTLIIWGTAIAFLIGFNFDLARPFYESSYIAGRVFTLVLVTLVLLIAVVLDMKMTKSKRRSRDESISIVQRRVTYSIWMLFAFSFVLDAFANSNLGGGIRMFGVYVVLGGITVSLFGLHAERWYKWCGVTMIVAGISLMFLITPSNTLRFAAASLFFIGGLACSMFATRAKSHWQCFGFSLLWITLSIALTITWLKIDYQLDIKPVTENVMTLHEYKQQNQSSNVIVRLPEGTVIPVKIDIGGDVFSEDAKTTLELKIAKPVDIEMDKGKPTGVFRIDNGKWLERSDAMYTSLFESSVDLIGENSPILYRKMRLGFDREFGGLKN